MTNTTFIYDAILRDNMDIAELEKVGLNKNEAIVYIELIKLGSASAGTLIRKTARRSPLEEQPVGFLA